MNNCWVKGTNLPITNGGTNAKFVECYNGKNAKQKVGDAKLKDRIEAMNKAWYSTEYMFDNNGNIVKR